MFKRVIILFSVLTSLESQAFTVNRALWNVEIKGLDSQLIKSEEYWVYGQYRYYFNEFTFSISDGLKIPEISINLTYKGNTAHIFETSSWSHFEANDNIQNDGISVSQSAFSFDAFSEHTFKSGSNISTTVGLSGNASSPSLHYSIENFSFIGGKGFNPSSSCNSMSCMSPYVTEGRLRINFTTTLLAVPESGHGALATAGIVVVGLVLSRRRRTETKPKLESTSHRLWHFCFTQPDERQFKKLARKCRDKNYKW